MITIESTSNSIFKETRKLLTAHGRKKAGAFIIEGERIVRDAIKKGADLRYIILSPDYSGNVDFEGIRSYRATEEIYRELKSTVNSQGILAVCGYVNKSADTIDYTGGVYLYLDSVQDPGNMGTIIRSADAFGVKGVILSKGCVDVFNPKVLRSTMSGIFTTNIFFDDGNILETFSNSCFDVVGTFPRNSVSSADYIYKDRTVIVMGNEANGICEQTEMLCTGRVSIPMTGNAESLNVSIACGIMLYEVFKNIN